MLSSVFLRSVFSFIRVSNICLEGPGINGLPCCCTCWAWLRGALTEEGRLLNWDPLSFFSRLEDLFSRRTTASSSLLFLSLRDSTTSDFSWRSRASSLTPSRRPLRREFCLRREEHSFLSSSNVMLETVDSSVLDEGGLVCCCCCSVMAILLHRINHEDSACLSLILSAEKIQRRSGGVNLLRFDWRQ